MIKNDMRTPFVISLKILDLNIKIRLINLYRVFNPVNSMSQTEFFENQLRIIRNAHESKNNFKIVLTGDFNLDHKKILT